MTSLIDEDIQIASTCPWAIPYGVGLANQMELPFIYVRQKQKDHGMKQSIEGISEVGKTCLVDTTYSSSNNYRTKAIETLEKVNAIRNTIIDSKLENFAQKISIKGMNIPIIEDLVSTGGSYIEEAKQIIELGANVPVAAIIFNYGLQVAIDKAKGVCKTESLLTYDVLLKKALDTGYINKEQQNMLAEWRQDPFKWGIKYGFHPPKK